MGVCTKEQEGMTAVVLMATPCTKSLECESDCPERRSPRYHETCLVTHLALESVEESSAAVCEPKGVWLRVPIIPSLKEACKGRKYLFFFVVMMFITVTAITVINNIFS